MPLTTDEPLGLRARKRAATRRAILLATIELVRDRGVDGVTVDEIARVADIAPRTFFNYFPSKDAAVVGDVPTLPADEHQRRFVEGRGHVLDDLAELLGHVADESLSDREIVQLRRDVIKGHPTLSALRMASLRHFEEELVGVVERRLEAEHPGEGSEADAGRLVAYVAMGAMRAAWVRWADGADESLALLLRRTMREARELLGGHPTAG
jgi:AcrR family transcriptional regulator